MYSGGNQLQITADTVFEFIQKMVAFYEVTGQKRPKYVVLSWLSHQRLKFEFNQRRELYSHDKDELITSVYGLQVIITYDKTKESVEFGT